MNAKRNLILLILFILSTLSIAPIQAQDTLPINHPKYQTAKTIFDDLIRAIGDGRTKPILHLLPAGGRSRMQVAWFRPDANTVTLEERAYDLCRAQGPDSLAALAALLGHELAHYYEDHGWIGDFGNGFADLEVAQTLKRQKRSPEKVVEIETQADYFGGFYGYVAGYNTLGVTPALLTHIYQDYELGDDLAGYPVLAERQAIARRSEEKLRRLIPVFEAGNRLLLLKKYSGAARCFDFIGRNFRSREILNNAGAARALEALDLFPADALRFAYPFEVDAETRLSQGGQQYRSGLDENVRQRRERLLEEAKSLFEQAGARDPGYATAHVNLACVAELTGAGQEALARAQEAVDLAQSSDEAPSLASALIIRGIARVRAGDEQGARADFKTAQSGRPALARLNQAVLDGDTATLLAVGGEKAG